MSNREFIFVIHVYISTECDAQMALSALLEIDYLCSMYVICSNIINDTRYGCIVDVKSFEHQFRSIRSPTGLTSPHGVCVFKNKEEVKSASPGRSNF